MSTAAPPDDRATRVTDLRLPACGGQGLSTLGPTQPQPGTERIAFLCVSGSRELMESRGVSGDKNHTWAAGSGGGLLTGAPGHGPLV